MSCLRLTVTNKNIMITTLYDIQNKRFTLLNDSWCQRKQFYTRKITKFV